MIRIPYELHEQLEPAEYVKELKKRCDELIRSGQQIDFYDAFAISRPGGAMAVYWLLPALRDAQDDLKAAQVEIAKLKEEVGELKESLEIAEWELDKAFDGGY